MTNLIIRQAERKEIQEAKARVLAVEVKLKEIILAIQRKTIQIQIVNKITDKETIKM